MSTAFHPQTDGQTERTNRTLEQILRNYVSYRQDDWDRHLATVEFAYNNAQQSSTSHSPFFLNHGHHPIVPANIHKSSVPTAEDFTLQMKNLLKIAQDNISQAQARQAKYANQHRREETFQEGDSVLISSENINLPSQALHSTKKFQAQYIGPYLVLSKILDNAYKIKLPETLKIHSVFYVSKLKRYTETNDQDFPRRIVPPPEPVIIDDKEEFEVEQILDKRIR